MSTTGSTAPTTSVIVPSYPRHHVHWFVMSLVVLFGLVITGLYFYRGQTLYYNGKVVGTVPDLTQKIEVRTPDGQTAVAQVPQPPAPVTSGTTDRIAPDGKLQRREIDVKQWDPIDRLTIAVTKTNETVMALGDTVKKIDGRVVTLGQKVDGIDARVATLEQKQVTPAPAQPTPSQAAPAQPAPAPTSQQQPGPAPQPQAAEPAPTQVAQGGDEGFNTDIVLPKGVRVHVNDLGDEANQRKVRACTPPKRWIVTKECQPTGRKDANGRPIKRCRSYCG